MPCLVVMLPGSATLRSCVFTLASLALTSVYRNSHFLCIAGFACCGVVPAETFTMHCLVVMFTGTATHRSCISTVYHCAELQPTKSQKLCVLLSSPSFVWSLLWLFTMECLVVIFPGSATSCHASSQLCYHQLGLQSIRLAVCLFLLAVV